MTRTRRVPLALAVLVAAAVVGVGPALAADTASVDGSSLPLVSAPQQVLAGHTSLDAGTELTVRLRSTDSSNPFLRQSTARVDDGGEFAAVFDMSNVPADTAYELTVLYDGATLAERSGTVVACDGNCTDSVPETPTATPIPGDGIVSVEQGEVAAIPVATGETGTAVFSFGSESVNYLVNASVTDGDGDGVTVLFDTANAGTDGETLSVADADDSLTVTREETELPSTLDPYSYEYRVFYGDDTDGGPDTGGTVRVEANDSTESNFDVDDDPTLGFERSVYTARQGETVRMPVTLGDAETATVSIGNPESGYEINATVRDGDGDGTVTVLFDTAAAGRRGQTLSTVSTADSLVVEPGSEVARDTRLDATEYDLTLYRGTATEDPVDIGTLSLQANGEATTGRPTATVSTGPEDAHSDPESGWLPGSNAGVLALGAGGLLALAGIGVILRPMG
ncbi:BGTF surface domain-containing protein [Haloarcula marina]|uniref:DUF7827 domain-containing protein n=1 Tax=Haloarcula marina TaxID=2961574 RepID=UPI0020B6DAB6|nr:BGTF surface domain-containing protein [Halomicroarcula marina]